MGEHMEPVVLLTNVVPPYRVSLFEKLATKMPNFLILISTLMEDGRPWRAEWGELPLVVQRSLTFHQKWKHPRGFEEVIHVHIPYDTLPILVKTKPRVIIAAEFGARTAQSAIYRILNKNSRLIVWATLSDHTEQNRGRLRALLRRWILRHADVVLVNGEAGARYIRRFGYPEAQIAKVAQTTEVQTFAKSGRRNRSIEERRRLLYVGRLIELKGIIPFIDVLSVWASRNSDRKVEFWLVGDGPLRDTLLGKQRPDNLELRLLGYVPYRELPQAYARAGILCFPTLADEWGLVVNEAMAAGLPVLGSLYSQAVEELVEDGITGWTFRPDHQDEMLFAIERALQTPVDILEKMGAAGREKATRLTLDLMAEQIIKIVDYVEG